MSKCRNIAEKKLEVPMLDLHESCPDMSEVSDILEKYGTEITIGEVNWEKYGYRPEVTMFCGYTEQEILLKYRVWENHIKAIYTGINDPVYEDSCVEFFISPGNEYYYNFEFNCIGSPYVAYGKVREVRIEIDKDIVSGIRHFSTLGNTKIEVREVQDPWELTLAIPFSMFKEEEFLNPEVHSFKANFCKCGDKLPVPHFLSWNPIDVKKPDFHRPEYFGHMKFLKTK